MNGNEMVKRMIIEGRQEEKQKAVMDSFATDIYAVKLRIDWLNESNRKAMELLSTLDTWDQNKKRRIMELLGGS